MAGGHTWQGACVTGGMCGRGVHGRGCVCRGGMSGRRDSHCSVRYSSYTVL